MTDSAAYTPPKVWTWNRQSGGRFANINRPIAGPTHDQALPVGRHPLQLYSLGTPNGVKVTVLLEYTPRWYHAPDAFFNSLLEAGFTVRRILPEGCEPVADAAQLTGFRHHLLLTR